MMSLTAAEFTATIEAMGFTPAKAGKKFKTSRQYIEQLCSGKRPIPQHIISELDELVNEFERQVNAVYMNPENPIQVPKEDDVFPAAWYRAVSMRANKRIVYA